MAVASSARLPVARSPGAIGRTAYDTAVGGRDLGLRFLARPEEPYRAPNS